MGHPWNTPHGLEGLLCELVGWRSVSGTDGERRFASRLAERLRTLPVLDADPSLVSLGDAGDGRSFVTALHRHVEATDTVVLVSHFDTVGTADFGALEPHACDPVALSVAMRDLAGDSVEEWASDARSGDYLFGRGAMDMKAGLALHMSLLARASSEGWPINLLLLAVPDEEVNSAGMRAAVPALLELQERHGLRYVLFLNGEPVFPSHPGDEQRRLYTGSIGKIMPSALCCGRETHAGTPLAGVTSPWIASFLTQAVEWSGRFRETVHGEATPLPVTLRQGDLRDGYSTQTPFRTSVLYNVFVMAQDARSVMDRFEAVARDAAARCMGEYRSVCEREGIEPVGELRVLRFEQLERHAVEQLGRQAVDGLVTDALGSGDDDLREQSMRIADALLRACPGLAPAIVLLFAPPYYPSVDSAGDEFVQGCVRHVQEQASRRFGLEVAQSCWFNGISDLSYVASAGAPEEWGAYERNMPGYGMTYAIPFRAMQRLHAPVLNVGPFGKDPHMRTERVHRRSAFVETPRLLEDLLRFIARRSGGA